MTRYRVKQVELPHITEAERRKRLGLAFDLVLSFSDENTAVNVQPDRDDVDSGDNTAPFQGRDAQGVYHE